MDSFIHYIFIVKPPCRRDKRVSRSPWRLALHAILACCTVMLCSCQEKPKRDAPQTYPVTGTLVSSSGKPMAEMTVQFRPLEKGAERMAFGTTDENGKFSLSVLLSDQKLPGATEGPHHVYVLPPMKRGLGAGRWRLKEKYTVKPEENHFELTLPSTRG